MVYKLRITSNSMLHLYTMKFSFISLADDLLHVFFDILLCSWGKNWGLNGYIRVARDKDNMCGVATSAMYPVLV